MKRGLYKRKIQKRNHRVFLLLISVLFLSVLTISVIAEEDNEETTLEPIDRAYSCLESELESDCGASASTEQSAFSLLAMAHKSGIQSDCKSNLLDKEQSNCFGATKTATCDLKSTAQAVLALNHIGADVDDYVSWLLDKRKSTTNLEWFLQIDANEATTCTISADEGAEQTFNMADNKKMSGTSSCLIPAESNYYLKISSTCYDKNFTISCDKDFITNLWYKKSGSSTMYISSLTHSSSASGTTKEKVNAYCFATSTNCDYQGSLWTALALGKTGKSVTDYIPYLSSMYDEVENKKYFPSAFLYMITAEDDYYIDVTEKQKQGKYWEEKDNKYYDTALALLSLQNLALEEVDNSKDYLLEIQDSSGCWHANNIKDTAFILYAWESKTPAISNGGGRADCESFGYYCTSSYECTDILDNYYCLGLSDVCCKTQSAEESCTEKGGIICESGKECTGSEVVSSDTSYCCLASCILSSEESECESYDYTCKTSCSDNEQEKIGYDCGFSSNVCCEQKEEKGSILLIFLLIILIILVILAIIFRNQVKIWFFRFKSKLKFGKPKPPSGRPPMTQMPMPLQRPRQILPRSNIPIRRQAPPRKQEKDSLFDDTMNKLKEMTK